VSERAGQRRKRLEPGKWISFALLVVGANTVAMKPTILISEFLDELSERADRFYNGRKHQAFLDWYIDAEFGQAEWKFTDDVNDGGIDAIVWRPDEIPPFVVLQSKFTDKVIGSQLSARAYRDFQTVVEAFYHGGEIFDGFLGRVRDDLRPLYRKAIERLDTFNHWLTKRQAFRLVTTCARRPNAEFARIPKENFIYGDGVLRLYEHFRKGATPVARPLELAIQDKLGYRDGKRGVTSYLFNARLSDFRKYFDRHDVARRVARNIRYNLGGRIGREIRRTFERNPHDFWYLHNGLTIICDDFIEKAQVATLINPSVVNGAQTLYAVSSSPRKESTALVATRVIVRGTHNARPVEDDEWLQGVIRGVNTQNRVRAYDFRSNEPEQIELQHKFRELKVFYERKRGEWREYRNEPRYRGFRRLSLRDLGLILTATADDTGQGVIQVKRGVEEIFDEKHYRKLFPSKKKVARRFPKIYLAYRLYKLLDEWGYGTTKEFRKQRHAFWNTLWVLHLGLTSISLSYAQSSLQFIRRKFDEFAGTRMWGRRAKRVIRLVRKSVWAAWRKARRSDPERWTPNNFFKSKFGNRVILRTVLPKSRPLLQTLGRHMANTQLGH
jgi:hypothetical protein